VIAPYPFEKDARSRCSRGVLMTKMAAVDMKTLDTSVSYYFHQEIS